MNSDVSKVLKSFKDAPYFSVSNLKLLGIKDSYLKIIISRLRERGGLVRLKREYYVSAKYVEKLKSVAIYNDYLEYIASKIYEPSYLSLEYVLHKCGIMTEMPQNFTLVAKRKTTKIINDFGIFLYSKIKDNLFSGYKIRKKGNFFIAEARPGKALFDFLYLRKNIIVSEENFLSLRLNIGNISRIDICLFAKFAKIAGGKMERILKWIC